MIILCNSYWDAENAFWVSSIKEKGEKEKKVKKTKYADKATKEKEYLKRADIQEATNVLQDLILLEEGKVKELPKITLNK